MQSASYERGFLLPRKNPRVLGMLGVVSLKGEPLAMPTFATAGFCSFFGLGRAVRCLLP